MAQRDPYQWPFARCEEGGYVTSRYTFPDAFAGTNAGPGEKEKKSLSAPGSIDQEDGEAGKWTGTWSTAPQLVEPHNMPPEPGLGNNTLRQVVRISVGGDSLRVRFSNEFSTSGVEMKSVHVAVSKGGGMIDPSTVTELKFGNRSQVTMGPGYFVVSDPAPFATEPLSELAITIFFGETSPDVTGHPGSRTTSWILPGDRASSIDFEGAVPAERWYVISGIDVKAQATAGSLVIIGNSITDGRGSGTNRQNRWPDILAERLIKNPPTSNTGVLNQGIGGNCVLRECLGPPAIERFDRDVLGQHGVRWLIILHGVNDIGQTGTKEEADQVAEELIAAYERMIADAHAAGILVYGATILPFGNSFYYTEPGEAARQKVNEWIRSGGWFDAVIDFDRLMRDPDDPRLLLKEFHTGDFLHPNEAGYRMMGDAVDLKLFE
ncbi:MAG: SGNH/GDSL hydrolase family protein [Marinilabiliales bacterium]|nr:MAG: SGNH/GDSL hydrolase family protein [Marinilabiliales bacterium]